MRARGGRDGSAGRGPRGLGYPLTIVAVAVLCAGGVSASELSGGTGRPRLPGSLSRPRIAPSSLLAAADGLLGAGQRRYRVGRAPGGAPVARGGGLSVVFGATGPAIRAAGGEAELSLEALGAPGHLTRVGGATPRAEGNRVTYPRRAVEEWYRNGPFGLEQGFTVARAPAAGLGWLTLEVGVSGRLGLSQRGHAVLLARPGGGTVLSYGDLGASDATGRALPTRLALRGRSVLLEVDAAAARYPVTIDPFVQSELLPGSEGSGDFGWSVAVSADASTALIGDPDDNGGSGDAWVFTRSGGSWSAQTELDADCPSSCSAGQVDDEIGAGEFGWSVSLSSDGATALIGGYADGSDNGAAWVFTQSGGVWSEQTKLVGDCASSCGHQGTGESPGADFGTAVAVSADGTTAVVGAPFNGSPDDGSIWIFARSGSSWAQTAAGLTPSDISGAGTEFGDAVASDGNGGAVLVGGYGENGSDGAAWVYSHGGGSWSEQARLIGDCVSSCTGSGDGSGEAMAGELGTAVAISSDGSTALLGAPDDGGGGSAWVFTASGSSWTNQVTIAGPDEGSSFGESVALSSSGNTALVGGYGDDGGSGALWLDARSGSSWGTLTKLTPETSDTMENLGQSAALSSTGAIVIGGAPLEEALGVSGAGWLFASTCSVGGAGNSVSATQNAAAVTVDPSLTVADSMSTTLSSATVTISGGDPSADVLAATTTGTAISASYTAPTLTLSGTDTLAHYRSVLDSVSFASTSSNGATRTVSWVVDDAPNGTANSLPASSSVVYALASSGGGGGGASVPGAPTGVSATAGDSQATVSFTAPSSNGGATISSYTVTSSAGQSASGSASPITVTGLSNGVGYTFTVRATNSAGTGSASSPSNPVTPTASAPATTTTATPTGSPQVKKHKSKKHTGTTTIIVLNLSVGGISIGESTSEVASSLGSPSSSLTISLGNGQTGTLARYSEGGASFVVTYDASGHVVSIEAYSSRYRSTKGIGPGSLLSLVARLPGFHVDYCEYGYWDGKGSTAPAHVVTVFTPNGNLVESILITELRYYSACQSAPAQPAAVPLPGAVVLDRSIGGVSIGASEAKVDALLGKPLSTLVLGLGGGLKGLFARYRSHGAPFLVVFDSKGNVISIEAYAPFYRTDGGLGAGAGSPLTVVAALHGFRIDYCGFGYWDGGRATAPDHIVTVFTPNGGEVASVLITEFRLYTACVAGSSNPLLPA